MKWRDFKRVQKLMIGLLICITAALAAALTVSGCGWNAGSDHSVRFNPYRTEKEFGRLPPLPKYASADQNKLFSWELDVDYQGVEKRAEQTDQLWDRAVEAERDGRLGDTRRLLADYLDITRAQRYARWTSPKDVQNRRNIATDKLDALGEMARGVSPSAVKAYLAARLCYDSTRQPVVVRKHLESARADKRLRDNADYLEAALRQGDIRAAAEFEQVAAKYPRSEKREASLFMAAVLKMKSSRAYRDRDGAGHEKNSCDDCRDEFWQHARAGFKRVMREYPHGRYYSDSRGWLGYLSNSAGDKAEALAEYYRMLGDRDEAGRVEALFSLALVRPKADDSEMEQVEAILEHEPAAALAYAYHDIYNHVFRSVYERYWDNDEDQNADQRELKRIASFATRMINRYPSSSVGAAFVVRIAEANLELEKYSDAAGLARRAIRMGARGDIKAEALWVAGVAESHDHQYTTARQALTTLVSENPNNRYTEGARRQLAILAEDTGDIEGALDQYLALDYRYDVAYFIDVLMTPRQLAAFIDKRPSLTHRDEMLYALGVRYLRDRRWSDAKTVFARVRTIGNRADEEYLYKQEWRRNDEESLSPKERDFDPGIRGIRPHWIDQDLRTANDLERLERQVETAQGDEARAEALYQVASYQFERSLLFYNPLEWMGQRHYLLVDIYERGAFRQPNESQMLFDHMQKHDMAANSLTIFLEVVRRFPNTRAARDALYTAAVCHERLHEYNNYWRQIYSDGGHAGDRMVTYRNVRAAYPSYRLPRGTTGWEPATRTVNGGPGWDKLPKPVPRPSRWARAARIANSRVSEGLKFLNRGLADVEYILQRGWFAVVTAANWVAHLFWILAMIGWLWFLWRRAAEARILMEEALAQCKSRPIEERGNSHLAVSSNIVSATLDKYLGHDLRDQWLEAGRDLGYKLSQVGSQRRGRALIAFYTATHGMFAVLAMRLALNW
jgi:TolA-binding protein